MAVTSESYTFTVGKLDAGMAILLGDRAHLIEFPSILLPPGASAGSIVNISVKQNHSEEEKRDKEFWELQEDILREFGKEKPQPPELLLRNVTQTAVTLEWSPVHLATSTLRSLDLYRNGQRLAAIPSPSTNTSTKVSGLGVDEDYTFQLILRTSAGTFPSNVVNVKTHTMEDTSGIRVCFGVVDAGDGGVLLDNAKLALEEMGGKWSDKIEIDTTHFICTTPAGSVNGPGTPGPDGTAAPGILYQRALQLSIPVLHPHWLLACHTEKKMVPVAPFYLSAAGGTPMSSATFRPTTLASRDSQSTIDYKGKGKERAIDPSTPTPDPYTPDQEQEDNSMLKTEKRKSRMGSMNREFKFPPGPPTPPQSHVDGPPPVPILEAAPEGKGKARGKDSISLGAGENMGAAVERDGVEKHITPGIITPSAIEVPPPPPVEKERTKSFGGVSEVGEDELGDTEEIEL